MAFESLTDRLSGIIKKIKGNSTLTEANMQEMLREIRIALLEADVNFLVAKEFVNNVKEKALGQEVLKKLNPSQMVVKIVHDELVELLGADQSEIKYNSNKPTIIMLCGLQGSGKTTTAGKLAKLMKNKLHKKVLLAACDVYRPAAIDQLVTIANQVGVEVVNMGTNANPVDIAKAARQKAYDERYDVLIIDTAGRLHIDEALMDELNKIKDLVSPDEILLLVDAMSGQDAVNVANSFNARLNLSGFIMSKLDGDARGGAALSIRHLTGLPIKLTGVGEKLDDLELFYPDRMADRILGMGDVMSLIEKAQENIDEAAARKSVNKMMDGTFDLNDMLDQMKQIQKMGSINGILKLIPGMPKISDADKERANREMKQTEAIIKSMTPYERKHPEILKNSRKMRIAKGCGLTNADINRMLKKFEQMKEMMKQMKGYKKGGKLPPMTGMGGGLF
ncbi:MAG: signal recognition particle protein [Erysipelotrichales bacterium]|nr:signal recognition particle protein [Erysipelotrichales bacterium]